MLANENLLDKPPKLVVFLVIDQGTPDLLNKYDKLYSGGLRFLVDNGVNFTQTYHDYSNTSTGPGHFVLASGMHPGPVGIIGNQWYDRSLGRGWYCAEDTISYDLISKNKASSYRNIQATALGDWLKSQNPKSKVVSLSGKDRSAVMMGGKNPDGVFWYNKKGSFTSSSYYIKKIPFWLRKFNKDMGVKFYTDSTWSFLKNKNIYDENARSDYFYGENDWTTSDGYNPSFPIIFKDIQIDRLLNLFYVTPFGDRSLLELSSLAIKKYKLGKDDNTDLLFIGLSAADGVGHSFGPYSQEQLDNLLRLDKNLGHFIDNVDQKIGNSNVLYVLTSDHGVIELPEYLKDKGFTSGRIPSAVRDSIIAKTLTKIDSDYGENKVNRYGYGFYYNDSIQKKERNEISQLLKKEMIKIPGIGMVLTKDEIIFSNDDKINLRLKNMIHPIKSPDVIIIPKRFWSTRSQAGASHGTPYDYDSHIPFFISSEGLKKISIETRISSIDIAPTVSSIIKVTVPDNVNGKSVKIFYKD